MINSKSGSCSLSYNTTMDIALINMDRTAALLLV